jgi:hypothetical protein
MSVQPPSLQTEVHNLFRSLVDAVLREAGLPNLEAQLLGSGYVATLAAPNRLGLSKGREAYSFYLSKGLGLKYAQRCAAYAPTTQAIPGRLFLPRNVPKHKAASCWTQKAALWYRLRA